MVTLTTEPVESTPTLPKSTELRSKQIAGKSTAPTPDNGMIVGLPAASSAITRFAFREPANCGLNWMPTVQLSPGVSNSGALQVVVAPKEKSFDADPVM